MRLADFDFTLPAERIALRPAEPRDSARLLLVPRRGPFPDRVFSELPDLLAPGDVVVLNETRVIPASLTGVRHREGAPAIPVQVNLARRLSPRRWSALAKPARRLRPGDRIVFGDADPSTCLLSALDATVAGRTEGGEVELAFDLSGVDLDLAIADRGRAPLPPYIAQRRATDARDRTDYQTVFAREEGSVAAPTAGLHFTQALLARLEARGVERVFLTLHVGPGTFQPVRCDDPDQHVMASEWGRLGADAARVIERARARGGRIVCVGTTSLRLLESAARPDGSLAPFCGETSLFVRPGYRFAVADALLTNFHLPRSTLFMLVAAFSGLERIRAAYGHAIEAGYRFYSYGDACLLERA